MNNVIDIREWNEWEIRRTQYHAGVCVCACERAPTFFAHSLREETLYISRKVKTKTFSPHFLLEMYEAKLPLIKTVEGEDVSLRDSQLLLRDFNPINFLNNKKKTELNGSSSVFVLPQILPISSLTWQYKIGSKHKGHTYLLYCNQYVK